MCETVCLEIYKLSPDLTLREYRNGIPSCFPPVVRKFSRSVESHVRDLKLQTQPMLIWT